MWREFKDFALRGNVVDLAVGIIVGSAFTAIVNSLVNDILMPPIGLILGNVDFSDLFLLLKSGEPASPYSSLAEAQAAGAVTINYGRFINSLIVFLIVAFATFLLVRAINRLYLARQTQAPEPTTKTCPFCAEIIPLKARRCPRCTSSLEVAPA